MTAAATSIDGGAPRRATCARCERPVVVCYCAHLPTLPTRTRVLLLQHPRERAMAIGTARMAHLALPNSALRIGTDFAADPVIAGALAAPQPPYLLFPGPHAVDVAALAGLARDRPVTLIVLDGTWWQAGKLLKLNPALQALPRVAFTPTRPSDYRIRRQPAAFCVSTIEALAETLNQLEAEAVTSGVRPFDRLLDPFRAMIDRQQWFATTVRTQRHRHPARPLRVPALAARIAAAWPRVVCVQGEANAWPKHHVGHQSPEIIHWVAHRPATGETFEARVAPRRLLAPGTPAHVALSADALAAGTSVADWLAAWGRFVRPDDVIVSWGRFYTDLACAEGLPLPADRIDLRTALSQLMHQPAGAIEDWMARLAPPLPLFYLAGRGGRRLAALVALAGVVKDPPPRARPARGRPRLRLARSA